MHPGGEKVLTALEDAYALPPHALNDARGTSIDRKQVVLPDHIKETGAFDVGADDHAPQDDAVTDKP